MHCNITQNAMGQLGGGGTLPGPGGGYLLGGTLPGEYPARGTKVGYPPPDQDGGGGYPVRTTEGVLTTQRAVCLLRSRRRTFLF